MSEPKILENVYPGLESAWETPHVCGHCMSHIGEDWLFCPYCGNEFYKEREEPVGNQGKPELKACPFCGETEMELSENTPEGCITEYFVSCSCCNAQISNDESMRDAITSWNQRV